jgi:hypothetical protein
MRSTVDLENALDRKLRKAATDRNLSFKDALNLVLAAGLKVVFSDKPNRKAYKVRAKSCGWVSGIDTNHLGALYDQVEMEDQLKNS